MSQRITDLVVIEAPGKVATVSRQLRHLAFEAPRVFATYGELLRLPERSLGVDLSTFVPNALEKVNPRVVDELRAAAAISDRVWLLTDADGPGELIAAQVAALTGHKDCRRVLVTSYHKDALLDGFQHWRTINVAVAEKVASQKVADRIIGYGISDLSQPDATGIAGRVLTGTLNALSASQARVGEFFGMIGRFSIAGSVPAHRIEDGKRVLDVLRERASDILSLPTSMSLATVKPAMPPDGLDALLITSRLTGKTITQSAAALQRLYESGRLTYLRSDSRHFTGRSRSIVTAMARAAGFTLVDGHEKLYRPREEAYAGAHEAVIPTAAVDVRRDPRSLTGDEAILTALGRVAAQSLAEPATVQREAVDPVALKSLLTDAGIYRPDIFQVKLTADTPTTRSMWLDSPTHTTPQLRMQPADETLLLVMRAANIGRPASYIRHINKIIERRLVDENGCLTYNGQRALEFAKHSTEELVLAANRVLANSKDPAAKQAAIEVSSVEMIFGNGLAL